MYHHHLCTLVVNLHWFFILLEPDNEAVLRRQSQVATSNVRYLSQTNYHRVLHLMILLFTEHVQQTKARVLRFCECTCAFHWCCWPHQALCIACQLFSGFPYMKITPTGSCLAQQLLTLWRFHWGYVRSLNHHLKTHKSGSQFSVRWQNIHVLGHLHACLRSITGRWILLWVQYIKEDENSTISFFWVVLPIQPRTLHDLSCESRATLCNLFCALS